MDIVLLLYVIISHYAAPSPIARESDDEHPVDDSDDDNDYQPDGSDHSSEGLYNQ